jgi:hypothetical protein
MTTLRQHMIEMHPRTPRPRSNADLITAHRREHHHFLTSHIHAGTNLGPGDRPEGWTTGADAVPRKKWLWALTEEAAT